MRVSCRKKRKPSTGSGFRCGFFVQVCPGVLIRLPDHFAERFSRVLQGQHEQKGPAVFAGLVPGECALAEVHLCLFPGLALQHVEALRLVRLQRAHEPLDRVVPMREAVSLHQVLINALRVVPQLDLFGDPLPVCFAGRAGLFGSWSRWPGWRSLNCEIPGFSRTKAGGHPGGI